MTKAVFTKNPDYKGTLDVKNDKVEMISYADADEMGTALDKGDIDLMTRTMSPEQINKLSDAANEKNEDLVELAGLEIRYLAFNTTAPVVKSKAVRQAMAQVIDRSELVSKVYGSQAEPLYSGRSRPPSPATPTRSSMSTATRTSPRPERSWRRPTSAPR
ncbi:Peptide-binding protein OS=Streptomyces alboniger OX=132473 GN=CP975_06460 PE=3 SV=1 [Streptomyces alboniger]